MALLGAMIIYLSLLFMSLLIAVENDFSIITHTISDLGNSLFTPAPFLFDCACIVAGIITVPYNYFIRKSVIYKPAGNSLKARVLHSTSFFSFCICKDIQFRESRTKRDLSRDMCGSCFFWFCVFNSMFLAPCDSKTCSLS
ncbi:hypothetical protein ES705_44548 [subsurface metagenome]